MTFSSTFAAALGILVAFVSPTWACGEEHLVPSTDANLEPLSVPAQEIGAWLAKARAHGKRLNVPEWGVWKNGDNAAYIQRMHAFFRANAAHIGYENYYNKAKAHELHPGTRFSKARSAYAKLW